MGLYRTVSEIDGDFSRKSHNFPTPVYFPPPLNGFPLELGTGAGIKSRVVGLPDRQRSLTITSAVWIECTNVTDRLTDSERQQRRRLRMASKLQFWSRDLYLHEILHLRSKFRFNRPIWGRDIPKYDFQYAVRPPSRICKISIFLSNVHAGNGNLHLSTKFDPNWIIQRWHLEIKLF